MSNHHIGIYCDNYDVIAGLILGVNWLTCKELPPFEKLTYSDMCEQQVVNTDILE